MTVLSGEQTEAPDTAAFLQKLNAHAMLLRVLVAVAEYGIADRLAAGPRTAAELAVGAKLHEGTLYRALRLLSSVGFFHEDDTGRFHLTSKSELLRTEVAGSLRDGLRRLWQDVIWRSYERVPDMLRTGVSAFDQAHGRSFFDYLAAQPELNAMFDRTMARVSRMENPIIAATYPFGRYGWIVDVGGGQGGLLAAILDAHPTVRGVLFDQPQVIEAAQMLADGRYEGRWEAASGDFFRGVPPGGDVYILKRIIHDWDDDDALAILGHCREALRGEARLLICDAVMRPGNEPDPNKFMDVNIMTLTSGRERTEGEFSELCRASGLKLLRVLALPEPATLSIIEVGLA